MTYNGSYDMDLWTEVAKHLDGRELVMLSLTNRWFNRLISEEYIWGSMLAFVTWKSQLLAMCPGDLFICFWY